MKGGLWRVRTTSIPLVKTREKKKKSKKKTTVRVKTIECQCEVLELIFLLLQAFGDFTFKAANLNKFADIYPHC